MSLDLAVLQTAAEVERLLPEWNALAAIDQDDSPFRRGDVAFGLWSVFAPDLEPCVGVARDAEGCLMGVLPLAWDRRRVGPMPLRILGPLPRWHGADFDATLNPRAPANTLPRLLDAIRATTPHHDAVVLQHIAARARIRCAVPTQPEDLSRRVRLGPDGPRPVGQMAKNLRRTTRRTLETFPTLQLIHGVPADEVRPWLHRFVALHALRWAGTTTPSQFAPPGVGDRFVAWFGDLVERGIGELHLMHAGDEILGGLCTLRARDGTYGWRLAVTTQHQALGLGIQLCHAVMASCARRGDLWYDLGGGEERYKGLWEADALPLLRSRSPGPGLRWRALATLGALTGRRWTERFLLDPQKLDHGTSYAMATPVAQAQPGRPVPRGSSMEITQVEYRSTDGTTLLAGSVAGERVFWECPTAMAAEPRGEPFVAALLPAAMRRGEAIVIPSEFPVDPTFLANVEQMQAIFARWFPGLHPVAIRATVAPHRAAGRLRATGYSGGLDSSYTVDVLGPHLDAVVLIDGIEYREERSDLSASVARRLHGAMLRRNLDLLVVRTNVKAFGRALGARWSVALGGALASAVHTLRLAEYHVAASNSWENLRPYGSHPVTDPLWSSAATTFRHHGADLRRIDKARHLSAVPDLLDELRVCFQGTDYNCGRCQKCLMTSAALRALGLTSPALPRLEDAELLRSIYVEHDGDLVDWEEIILPDLATRDPALHGELVRLVRRYRWRQMVRTMDELATGGRIRTLLRRRANTAA